jgi:hypothetical protein
MEDDLLETNIFVPDNRQSITQPPSNPKLKQAFRQQYEQRRKSAMPRDVLPNDLYQDALLMEHGIKYCDEMDPNLSKDRYLKEKRHAVSIDSRARDTTKWSNPNHYVIELPDTYRQVKSIRLTGAIIPNTDQVINNDNNDIYFQIAYDGDPDDPLTPGVDQYHIIITPGNYTGPDLARSIKATANAEIIAQSGDTLSVDIMNVTFSDKSMVFEITPITENNPDPSKEVYFTWTFALNTNDAMKSMHYLVGFETNATVDSNGDLIYVQDFSNQVSVGGGKYTIYRNIRLITEEYIFMCIKGMQTLEDTMKNVDTFAKILLDVPGGSFAFNTFETNAMIYANVPLTKLSELEISFYRSNRQLYNFNGLDHTLSFEIIEHADYLVSSNFSSIRGVGDSTSVI